MGEGIARNMYSGAGIMDEMELMFHLIHDNQPAAILFDNNRSCKYSYVLLMMGVGIARNM
jgi:hypothetical protein